MIRQQDRVKGRFSTLGCALMLVTHLAFPCFQARIAPEAIRPQHYVFEGVVREIVAPMEPAYLVEPAWGLLVEVGEVNQAPHPMGLVVKVYPFDGHNAGCDWIGLPRERVEAMFPVGARVSIAATAYPASQAETAALPDRLFSEKPLHMRRL